MLFPAFDDLFWAWSREG